MTIIQSDAPTSPAAKITGVNAQYEFINVLVVQHSYDGRTSDHPCVKDQHEGRDISAGGKGALSEGGERVTPGSHQGASVVCPTTTMPP